MKIVAKTLLTLSALTASIYALAEDRFDDVEIKAEAVADNIFMLTGAGGNMAVMRGDDGVLLVDDQYQQLAEKIGDKVTELTGEPVRYLINTHFHGDHVGSNSWFYQVQDSTIMAHDNVRKRLADDDNYSTDGLPVITYDSQINLHINQDTVHVFHLPSGHTDGDSAVWFESANVLHPGDLFFNKRFPFIDLNSGGSVDGYISNVTTLLDAIDQNTIIIPGHGPKANKADYQEFLAMIEATKAEVDAMKEQGLTVEEAVAKGLSDQWQSWHWNFITEERWITTLYQ